MESVAEKRLRAYASHDRRHREVFEVRRAGEQPWSIDNYPACDQRPSSPVENRSPAANQPEPC